MNTKKYFKKIISLTIISVLILTPVVDFAQTNNSSFIDAYNSYGSTQQSNVNSNSNLDGSVLPPRTDSSSNVQEITPVPVRTGNQSLTPDYIDSQIQNSVLATRPSTSTANQSNATGQAAGGVASCLGSQVVSQIITQAVSGTVSAVTDSLLNVPVAESGTVKANIVTETSARVGTVLSLGGIGSFSLPSWDSIGYCIVNSMIIYIANSTIDWITSGFEGNPAFLTNPDQFFVDLANAEKRAFIQNLAYGVNSGVCGAFKGSIVSAVLSRYGRNQQNYSNQQGYENGGYGYGNQNNFNGCAFDQNPGQLNAFLGGNFTEGGGWNTWFQLTQNPNNNPYDTFFRTNERLNTNVEAVKLSKTTELNWNNGYLSYRKCENGEKDTSKCSITTPGTVIQSKLESTLDLGTNRLVLAEKFDQVVTALVDQLITTALDKTFETINSN